MDLLDYLILLVLALISAIHVACYGSFKDTPYESLKPLRIVREMLVSLFVLPFLFIFFRQIFSLEKFYVIFGLILIFSRIVTEVYKQFFRVEDQSQYKIPSQVHLFRKIPKNRIIRFGLMFIVILFLLLAYKLSFYIINLPIDILFKGLLIGFTGGLMTAIGGGYKDGFFEGFDKIKFFRSPIVTAFCAVFLSMNTNNPAVILFAAMGYERMIVEFYKGFIKSGYIPGKFKAKKPVYPEWLMNRKVFILPYAITWAFFLSLLIFDL